MSSLITWVGTIVVIVIVISAMLYGILKVLDKWIEWVGCMKEFVKFIEWRRSDNSDEHPNQEIAGEAYQIIGALADEADLMSDSSVYLALEHFGRIANGKESDIEILPFTIKQKDTVKNG